MRFCIDRTNVIYGTTIDGEKIVTQVAWAD
jgi:hypothetical protein